MGILMEEMDKDKTIENLLNVILTLMQENKELRDNVQHLEMLLANVDVLTIKTIKEE